MRNLSKDRLGCVSRKHVINVRAILQALLRQFAQKANHQFSFIRAPGPQKTDSSPSRLEDGGRLVLEAMTFKLFVKSRPGARNADEVGSSVRVVALSGGKFSEVCARCKSGRRCTSVTATEVGSGGRGTFGGGTGGGLRSARRGLKCGVSGLSAKK